MYGRKDPILIEVNSFKTNCMEETYNGSGDYKLSEVYSKNFGDYIKHMSKIDSMGQGSKRKFVDGLSKIRVSAGGDKTKFLHEINRFRHANFIVNFVKAYNRKIRILSDLNLVNNPKEISFISPSRGGRHTKIEFKNKKTNLTIKDSKGFNDRNEVSENVNFLLYEKTYDNQQSNGIKRLIMDLIPEEVKRIISGNMQTILASEIGDKYVKTEIEKGLEAGVGARSYEERGKTAKVGGIFEAIEQLYEEYDGKIKQIKDYYGGLKKEDKKFTSKDLYIKGKMDNFNENENIKIKETEDRLVENIKRRVAGSFQECKNPDDIIKECDRLKKCINGVKVSEYIVENENRIPSVVAIRATAAQMVKDFNEFTKAYSYGRGATRNETDDSFNFSFQKGYSKESPFKEGENPCGIADISLANKLKELVKKTASEYQTNITNALGVVDNKDKYTQISNQLKISKDLAGEIGNSAGTAQVTIENFQTLSGTLGGTEIPKDLSFIENKKAEETNTILVQLGFKNKKLNNKTTFRNDDDFKKQNFPRARINWLEEKRNEIQGQIEESSNALREQLGQLGNLKEKIDLYKQGALNSENLLGFQTELNKLSELKIDANSENLANAIKAYKENQLNLKVIEEDIENEKELQEKKIALAKKVIEAYNDTVPVGNNKVKLDKGSFSIKDGDEVKRSNNTFTINNKKIITDNCLNNVKNYCEGLVNLIGTSDYTSFDTIKGEIEKTVIKETSRTAGVGFIYTGHLSDSRNNLFAISCEYKNTALTATDYSEYVNGNNYEGLYEELYGKDSIKKIKTELKQKINEEGIKEKERQLKAKKDEFKESLKTISDFLKEDKKFKNINEELNFKNSSSLHDINSNYESNFLKPLSDLIGKCEKLGKDSNLRKKIEDIIKLQKEIQLARQQHKQQALINTYNTNTPIDTQALELQDGEVKEVDRQEAHGGKDAVEGIENTQLAALRQQIMGIANTLTAETPAKTIDGYVTTLNAIGTEFDNIKTVQDDNIKINGKTFSKNTAGRGKLKDALNALNVENDDELVAAIERQFGITVNNGEVAIDANATAEQLAAQRAELEEQKRQLKEEIDALINEFEAKNTAITTALGGVNGLTLDDGVGKLQAVVTAYNDFKFEGIATKLQNYVNINAQLTDLGAKITVNAYNKQFNELKNLYIGFASASNEVGKPQDIYFYNKNYNSEDDNIKGKQSALVDSLIEEYNNNGDLGIDNYIKTIKETEEFKNISNEEDTKLDFLKACITSKDKVRVYDALSDIFMDLARDSFSLRLTNTFLLDGEEEEDFDKAYTESARKTLEHISKCAVCAKKGTKPEDVGITADDVDKFKRTLDNNEFSDYINHLERSRIVSEINYNNEIATEEEEKVVVPACADASKGREWSNISEEYKDCVKNYNNSIEFDGIDDEYGDDDRTITFKNDGCEFTIKLDGAQAIEFDMLEFGKHVGKDIGLFAGFCSYISEHPEIGIDENNISNILNISKNGRILTDQNAKNEVILKSFSGPKFNNILVKSSSSTKRDLANSITTDINRSAIADSKIGEMTLVCLGETVEEQPLSRIFKGTINGLSQGKKVLSVS